MKDTELKKARDRDLYGAYVRAIQENRCTSLRDAADIARKSIAERYYISASEAALHIGKILSGISLLNLSDYSRKRIWQLYDCYQRWLDEHPGSKLSRERILEELVSEPAPEFYISESHARHIIMNKRREIRRSLGL